MSTENIVIIDLKKEKKREYDKERIRPLYYQEKRAEKIFCNCGCLIRQSNMKAHIKTSKHEETLKKQTDENKLNIKQLNEIKTKEIKEKYDEKKNLERIKKEQEKKEEEEKLKQIRAKREQRQSRYLLISCPCGSEFQKREQNRHERSKQHIEYLQTQNKSQ